MLLSWNHACYHTRRPLLLRTGGCNEKGTGTERMRCAGQTYQVLELLLEGEGAQALESDWLVTRLPVKSSRVEGSKAAEGRAGQPASRQQCNTDGEKFV
jgi:hypothetical protein